MKTIRMSRKQVRYTYRTTIFLSLCTLIFLMPSLSGHALPAPGTKGSKAVLHSFTVIAAYPHDADAMTEGFTYRNGFFYESSGNEGASVLRKSKPKTGEAIGTAPIGKGLCAQGMTIAGTRVLQLACDSGQGFIYNLEGFAQTGEFIVEPAGWGLAFDGKNVIVSDGSNTIRFLDANTFAVKRSVQVRDSYATIDMLDELEYINGRIYATIMRTNYIVIILPDKGDVSGWIDCSTLRDEKERTADVLTAIAADSSTGNLFVTGPLWSHIYEIRLTKSRPSTAQ